MLSQDVVRRLTVVANETGLTTLKQKLDAVDNAQDRVAVSGARMGRATDEAQRRIQQLVSSGGGLAGGLLGGLGGRAGAEALAMFGRFVPAAAAAYGSFKLLNATVEQGVALLEKYGLAGQRALYGGDNEKELAHLTRFQNDTASAQQIRYASELSDRLDTATQKIKDFAKVQFDLTDPALRLMHAWTIVAEQIAKAADAAKGLPSSPALGIPGRALVGALPFVGPAYNAYRGANAFLPGPETVPEPTAEEALAGAKRTLAAGLGNSFNGRFFGVPYEPPKPQAAQLTRLDEYDRAMRSIEKQTQALQIQADTFGMTTEQAARYRVEQELRNAATLAGKTLTEQDDAAIRGMAGAYGQAAEGLERLREQQQRATELNHAFRDSFGGFAHDLKNGATATDAMTNALSRLSDRLLDMAINQVWEAAFPKNSGGLFGMLGGGSQFAGPVGQTGVVGPMPGGGGLFGGLASLFMSLPFFAAEGGSFGAGRWGVVGERGPELIQAHAGGGVSVYSNAVSKYLMRALPGFEHGGYLPAPGGAAEECFGAGEILT